MNTKLVESLAEIIRSLSDQEKSLLYQELNLPTQNISETVSNPSNLYPLQGKQPYRYDDPFEPAVSIDDWEALK